MTMTDLALENAALTRTLADTRMLLDTMTRRVMELEKTVQAYKDADTARKRDELEEAMRIIGGGKSADDYRAEMIRRQKRTATKPTAIMICRGTRRCR